MKLLQLFLLTTLTLGTSMASEIRELPSVVGAPQIIQDAKLLPKLKLLAKSNDIEHKQLLIDCLEYSYGPYSDETMTLEEKIPALGLAEESMGDLEMPLIVFSALKTTDQVLKNRLGLLAFKLTNGKPVEYGEKLGFTDSDKVGAFLAFAQSSKDLDELAFFEGFAENPKMLEFLKNLDSQE